MEDEFTKIMKFFDLPPEDKAGNLGLIFEEASVFLERFREIMEKGSLEEKKEFLEKVAQLQRKIQGETFKLTQETGLTAEQIMQFAMNPQNFSKEQWETISTNKEKLEEQAREIRERFSGQEDKSGEKPKQSKPSSAKRKKGGRKDWISG